MALSEKSAVFLYLYTYVYQASYPQVMFFCCLTKMITNTFIFIDVKGTGNGNILLVPVKHNLETVSPSIMHDVNYAT